MLVQTSVSRPFSVRDRASSARRSCNWRCAAKAAAPGQDWRLRCLPIPTASMKHARENHGRILPSPYTFPMIRALLYGLGPIGMMVARQLAAATGFRIVGAVDVDPAKVGRDLGDLLSLERPLRVKVDPDRDARHQEIEAGHRRALHFFVRACGDAADRRRAEAESADRHDDRGAELSRAAQRGACENHRHDGEAGESRRALDRRQSRDL